MAKYNELIYDVREALKQYSDDSEVDNRYIGYQYNIKRAKYLRQDLNNYLKTVDNSIQQTLCLELEEVSTSECGLDLPCETIMRTKVPMPKPLDLHTKPAIIKIKSSTKLAIPFNIVTKERIVMLGGSRYANSVYAFLDVDNRIYLYSKSNTYKMIECINITAVFENPLELQNYKNCCNCEDVSASVCYDVENSEYPLQPHYINVIRKEIVNDMINMLNIPEDKDNNSND